MNTTLESMNEIFELVPGASTRYLDPNGKEFAIAPFAFITNSLGETILADGRGWDRFGRAFRFENNLRDLNPPMKVQKQPNWMGNRRPNFTTNPGLSEMSHQGTTVLAYQTVFGSAIDWVATEAARRQSAGCIRGI